MKGLYLFLGLLLIGCNTPYKREELKAIEDIANEYLKRNNLNAILDPPPPPPLPFDTNEYKSPNKPIIDTLDLKVYLSDALMPISQIKEDNEWMFENNYYGTQDSTVFRGIVNSNIFKKLNYREFNKHQIKFIKPYRYFEKHKEGIGQHDSYTILYFSRVCFDNKKENGVVVIDYQTGFDNGTASGYYASLLIRKLNGKWTYIDKK